MKKNLTILAIALSCFCISCNSKTEAPVSAATQKNLDAMHGVTKAFETSDFSKLGDYIAQDAVDHAGENGDLKGLDSIKAEFAKSNAQMGSQKSETIKELADDEYVMSWMHYSEVMKTDGMGLKAGDTLNIKTLEVARFVDGKAVEHWSFMEPRDVMKMMASMPKSTMPMSVDSAKKKM
jgi:predicted ester cyclase